MYDPTFLALDITYESLARSFNMPLSHHQDTLKRMEESAKLRYNIQNQTAEQRTARERMAYFPSGEDAEVIHVHKDLWVVSAWFYMSLLAYVACN